MAKVTSGSFNTGDYSGRYYTFSWTATQSTTTNKSTISWKLEAKGGSSSWYAERTVKVVIAGTEVWGKTDKVSRYKGVVASGTTDITHNNNGTKSFSASVKAAVYLESINCTGSGTWDLKDIPRAATITSAPDFTDEENPTITFSNPSKSTVEACIAKYDATSGYWVAVVGYKNDIKTTDTSYIFSLNDNERAALRRLVTASDGKYTIKFYLRTTIDGTYYYNSVEKTLSLVNYTPTLNPTVEDVGSLSKLLTGNSKKFIKHYNVVKYDSGAVVRKEATVKSIEVSCGNVKKTTLTGELGYVESDTVKFTLTDNRGSTVTKNVKLDLIPYKKLTCRMAAQIALSGETTSAISFTVNGDYWSGNFGATNNELELKYRIKSGSGEYGEPQTISSGISIDTSKGTYSFNGTLGGLDYKTTYTIQIVAFDKVFGSGIYSNEVTLNTTPLFIWDDKSFDFNIPITVNGGNVLAETVLYNNTSGANGVVTLAASANNFTYLDIFYTDNNGSGAGYVRVFAPEGKKLHLSLIESIANGGFYIRHTNYTISGDKLTPDTTTAGYTQYTGTAWNKSSASNYLKIKRVVGVK